MIEPYEVPEIKEELERKTFAELENLISKRELGRITNAEYVASIGTLFSICSGLVDGDFFNVITEAGKAYDEDYSFNRTRIIRKGKSAVVITRASTAKNFRVTILKSSNLSEIIMTGERDETDTNIETELKIYKLLCKLETAGYCERI